MANIHSTSIIEPGAELADDVEVGPFCYIGSKVRIGSGTRLISHVMVQGRTTIGSDNRIWSQAVVGADPQDLKFHGEDAELIIGDNNDIRECASLHIGTENGGGFTRVGNDSLIMAYAHVGHDCIIGDNCIVTNAVQLAGHIVMEDHAIIGGATAVHSFVTVGQYAYVGGMTRCVHDVPPFMIVEGNPAKVRGVNRIGMERNRFDPVSIMSVREAYKRLYRGIDDGTCNNTSEKLIALERDYPDDECIGIIVQFVRNRAIGTHGRFRETTRKDDRHANPAK